MALTKEEEDEIKILFGFPLILSPDKRKIVTRNRNNTFFIFDGAATRNDQFKEAMLIAMNHNNMNLGFKNITFECKNVNYFYMNGKTVGYVLTIANFETLFGFDFIKAQRINRIYREYILEKMTKTFNKSV